MATRIGPGNLSKQNLIFGFDSSLFPAGWGVTQLIPNPEFIEGGARPYDHGCYTSGYYLGPDTSSIMTGGTLRFTGGDLSNYYVTNPEYRGWDSGGIGNTGGNWMHYVVLPQPLDSAQDFIVQVKARFVYVSRTGNGSANPRFQIGRSYYEQYGINYYELGKNFQTLRFSFNGASIPDNNVQYLTFGCTSPDAMLELDHFRAYNINKSAGLQDLAGNLSINISNVSFNSSAEFTFDGTDDFIEMPASSKWAIGLNGTLEMLVYRSGGVSTNHRLWCVDNNNTSLDAYLDYTTGGLYMHGGSVGTNTQIPLNQWLHIVVTYTGGVVKIYYNGVSQPIVGGTPRYNITNAGTLYVGRYVSSSGYRWNGKIALFKIYSTPLLPSEIERSYKSIKSKYSI